MLSDKALAERSEKRNDELFFEVCKEVAKRHKNMTQREVADIYGVTYRTWQRWIAGQTSPKKPQARAFARATRLMEDRILSACVRTRAFLRGTPVAEPPDAVTPLYTPPPVKVPPPDDSGGNWPGRRF